MMDTITEKEYGTLQHLLKEIGNADSSEIIEWRLIKFKGIIDYLRAAERLTAQTAEMLRANAETAAFSARETAYERMDKNGR